MVIKRFMIPLGIYRTERVSFAGLDPSDGESGKARGDDDEGGDMALIRMTTKVVMGPHQRMDLKRKMSLRA